jgi:DNA-directed RNA polymerase specialized sigma24 family protein
MATDAELLRQFADTRSDAAFAEIVRRHIDFVSAAALRQVHGDAHLAADVTQQVFVDLARKSATLAGHPVLIGWLHTSARFASIQLIRAEQRRLNREREACTMRYEDEGEAIEWSHLQPWIDGVLGRLKPIERDAILLRFFRKAGVRRNRGPPTFDGNGGPLLRRSCAGQTAATAGTARHHVVGCRIGRPPCRAGGPRRAVGACVNDYGVGRW